MCIRDSLYGVKAYKSYFMLGDYMVALGAGITNKQPEMEGNIRTTIEQTEKTGRVYAYKGKGIEWMVQQDKFAYSVFPQYINCLLYTSYRFVGICTECGKAIGFR